MESARRVAVVATTRTGSTWPDAPLDSHPGDHFHGEGERTLAGTPRQEFPTES